MDIYEYSWVSKYPLITHMTILARVRGWTYHIYIMGWRRISYYMYPWILIDIPNYIWVHTVALTFHSSLFVNDNLPSLSNIIRHLNLHPD